MQKAPHRPSQPQVSQNQGRHQEQLPGVSNMDLLRPIFITIQAKEKGNLQPTLFVCKTDIKSVLPNASPVVIPAIEQLEPDATAGTMASSCGYTIDNELLSYI